MPFENLTVQLGESAPLAPAALVARVLAGGRGGYCFEVNTVLQLLLEALGFAVERRAGVVGDRSGGGPTNHLALVVRTPDGEPFVAEAGLGEGPLDPLPLAAGTVRSGASAFRVERDGDGWWVALPAHASSPGVRFAGAAATLADFAPHHERLSQSADSPFVRTLVVQRPYEDRIVTLRARTVFVDGPGRRERSVLAGEDEFAAALHERFGIDPAALGAERVGRLWERAQAQHAAHRPA